MSTREELQALRELSAEDLREKAESLKEELMRLRFRHAAGQLETTAQLKNTKQSIARIFTILREKDEASAATAQ